MSGRGLRAAVVDAVQHGYGTMRKSLRFLGYTLVLPLLLLHGIATAAYLSGSATTSDFLALNGVCAPLTLACIWVVRWTHTRGEAPLLEALSHVPPMVRGASFMEFGRGAGTMPGIEIQTLDGKLWRVKMEEALARDAAHWLSSAARRVDEANYSFRSAPEGAASELIAWSSIGRLAPICVHCALPSERSTEVRLHLRRGAELTLTLPICARCARRKITRLVAGVLVSVAAVVGGAVLASYLYPPGSTRGLVIGGVAGPILISLYVF